MTRLRSQLIARSASVAFGTALFALAASGCTASAPSASDASAAPAAASSSPEAAPSTAEQDEVTCAGFGNVQTILFNSHAAFAEGRMEAQEERAWSALASRVLDTVPAAEEGPVADALAELQSAVPPTSGAKAGNFDSDEAQDAAEKLFAACEAEGFDVAVEGFVGG